MLYTVYEKNSKSILSLHYADIHINAV